MSPRSFALAIDSNLVRAAEVADAQLVPAVASGRTYSEPIEDRGDAMVGQHASEFADELHSLLVGLEAVLANAVLHDFKSGVISALPMQDQAQSIALDRDDDLLENCPQDSLADFDGSTGIVPNLWQVISECEQHCSIIFTKRPGLLMVQILHLLLESCHRCEAFIPSPFELAGDQTIVGINRIVLPACMHRFVACLFQCKLALSQPLYASLLTVGDQLKRRFHCQR